MSHDSPHRHDLSRIPQQMAMFQQRFTRVSIDPAMQFQFPEFN